MNIGCINFHNLNPFFLSVQESRKLDIISFCIKKQFLIINTILYSFVCCFCCQRGLLKYEFLACMIPTIQPEWSPSGNASTAATASPSGFLITVSTSVGVRSPAFLVSIHSCTDRISQRFFLITVFIYIKPLSAYRSTVYFVCCTELKLIYFHFLNLSFNAMFFISGNFIPSVA